MSPAGEVEIEIWKWRGVRPDKDKYAVADLDQALAQLSGSTPTDISLSWPEGAAMFAGGHDGRFVLTFTPNGGEENWHAETATPQTQSDLPDLVVGGQAADFPASLRLTWEEVSAAATWFVESSDMNPSLPWVQD